MSHHSRNTPAFIVLVCCLIGGCRITLTEQHVHGIAGRPASLPCELDPNLDIVTVRWRLNSTGALLCAYFPENTYLLCYTADKRFSISKSRELIISRLQHGDSGFYLCTVSATNAIHDLEYLIHLDVSDINCTLADLPIQLKSIDSKCIPNLGVRYGDVCHFECPGGYNLVGKSNVTCSANGTFESMPYCEVVHSMKVEPSWIAIIAAVAMVMVVVTTVVLGCYWRQRKRGQRSNQRSQENVNYNGEIDILLHKNSNSKCVQESEECIDTVCEECIDTGCEPAASYTSAFKYSDDMDMFVVLLTDQLTGLSVKTTRFIKGEIIKYIHESTEHLFRKTSEKGSDNKEYDTLIWKEQPTSSAGVFALYIWIVLKCLLNERQMEQAESKIMSLVGKNTGNTREDTYSTCSFSSQQNEEYWDFVGLVNISFCKLLELEYLELTIGDDKRKRTSDVFNQISGFKKQNESHVSERDTSKQSSNLSSTGGTSQGTLREIAGSYFATKIVMSIEQYELEEKRADLRTNILKAFYSP